MTRQPFPHRGMLVGGIAVEDRVDGLADGNGALDGVEETDELLMPVTLHVAADHRPVPARPFFIGRPGWVGSVERLD